MSLITDIQKYSIHDGDGIRTTVFFKGCNLRCTWCHNPETQSYKKELLFDEDRCVGCGSCVPVCPSRAITLERGKAVTDRKKCTACGKCTDYCNLNLREVAGKEYPVDQLVEELVKKLHHFGISVTVDTCGQAPYENYERILPYVDTFLYDIKLMDSEIHKKYMGTGNELILSNLEKLSRDGARLYIRIPTVKEVNGSDEAMKAIINYLLEKNIHVTRVNLLPYHNTGSGKYMKIGKNYEGADLHAPDKEEMNHFVELFREAGFHNIKIGG